MPKLYSSRQIIKVLTQQGFIYILQKGMLNLKKKGTTKLFCIKFVHRLITRNLDITLPQSVFL
ncbi:MAG TPA: hypothetical protein DDX47_05810 [Candidatus Jacksonbacteria bacterium]|nr:MAG: hypothetical protein A2240_03455 [Candidatus Jacksonbacteria bacterium RIFOXYA2_FULL_43_12]OGY79810.1 MAG: hypothetical protein A2550_04555 [Candidatus Jacksonbacteria bacterium RIFOXYD2_FULL_43_21]HBH46847.1 hypothetical protein [Candidatus Jacksonbacteria bacterium]